MVDQKKQKGSVSAYWDAFLLLILGLATGLTTLGRIDKDSLQYEEAFYEGLQLHRDLIPHTVTIVLTFVLLFFLTISLLIHHQGIAWNKRNKICFLVFLSFFFVRAISILSFPKGEQDLVFTIHDITKAVHYKGFSWGERFYVFGCDFFFYGYFFLLFALLPELKREIKFINDILIRIVLFFVLSLLLYSFIQEADCWRNNFFVFFTASDQVNFLGAKSYTSNKNAFGFFLLFGFVFCFEFFLEKAKAIDLISMLVLEFTCFFSSSRTPFLVIFVLILLLEIFFPILNFQKRKSYSIFLLSLLAIKSLFILISLTGLRNHFLPIYTKYFNLGTVDSRIDIMKEAICLMNTPYFILFGYSRYPFYQVFHLSRDAFSLNHMVFESHCSYVDLWIENGALGCLYFLVFYGYLVYFHGKRFAKNKDFRQLVSLLLMLSLLCYSFLEPRMLLLEEGTSVLFTLILVQEVTNASQNNRKHQLLTESLE